jgi:beta-xylosidase
MAVAVTVVAATVLVATLQPWRDAASAPTTTAGPTIGHRSSLADSTSGDTVQPLPATDPWAPGQHIAPQQDRSDPFLLRADGRYYLYTSSTTSLAILNVPVSSSTNFQTWTRPVDAMPVLPAWAVAPFTWAPDVHKFGSVYVLYFTGYLQALNEQCIGAATGSSPVGPFTAQPQPFICQSGLSGSIDPRVFTDTDGTNWVLFKSDQNAHGRATPTTLWSQQLTPDGLGLVGTASDLMSPDEPWQGSIVEAPDMVKVNGVYWLAYSGNWFNQPLYGIGVAWCAGPSGPCADSSDTPLIGTNAQGQGPGEASLYQDQSGVWVLYTPEMQLPGDPARQVYIARVGFATGGAYLAAGGLPTGTAPTSQNLISAP